MPNHSGLLPAKGRFLLKKRPFIGSPKPHGRLASHLHPWATRCPLCDRLRLAPRNLVALVRRPRTSAPPRVSGGASRRSCVVTRLWCFSVVDLNGVIAMPLVMSHPTDSCWPVYVRSGARALHEARPLPGRVGTGVGEAGPDNSALIQMSRARRSFGRTILITLLTAVGFPLLPSGVTSTANAVEFPEPSVSVDEPSVSVDEPSVSVDPTSGGPGTTVTAVATGYGACKRYVTFFWDDARLEDDVRLDTLSGSASTAFTVPDSAAAGDHQVQARCAAGDSVAASTGFTVPPGQAATVIVPNVIGMSVDDAASRLIEEGLVLGEVSGNGDVIEGQDPPQGAELTAGSAVNVSVDPIEPPSQSLVEVPDVTEMTVEEATAAVAAAGLVSGNTPDGDGDVESQQPEAGTLVRAGSAVTLTLTSSPEPPWWPIAPAATALVLLLVLGATLAAYQTTRASRDRRWLRKHMRLVPGAASAPGFDIRESRTELSAPTLVVRLEPQADRGKQVLEEVPP